MKSEMATAQSGTKTYIFQKHSTLITTPIPVKKRRHQSAGINTQQLCRFLIGVNLYILIGDAFGFERDPHALDKGAEKSLFIV